MSDTCLIICPEPVVRLGLRHLLVLEAGLRVCAETGRPAEALMMRDQHRPDLAVLCCKHGEDLALVRDLSRCPLKIGVLVVAHEADANQVQRALKAGALGYVLLEDEERELLRALATVRAGSVYVSHRVMGGLRLWLNKTSGPAGGVEALSERELEIFRLMSRGQGSKEIAGGLNISVKTVETHKQRMKDKLKLTTCAELSRHALQMMERAPLTRREKPVGSPVPNH